MGGNGGVIPSMKIYRIIVGFYCNFDVINVVLV